MSNFRRRLLMLLSRPSEIEGLIARYACYDKTNEDEDRDILKDLSGNGHDIQLYNFAFAEGSGYGKYATNYLNYSSNGNYVTNAKIIINKSYIGGNQWILNKESNPIINSYKVKISNIPENVLIYYFVDSDLTRKNISLKSGINILPTSYLNTVSVGFYVKANTIDLTGVVIEQIPDYKGALVSDGVDDYGLCEKFPILNRDRGYTVCTIRKILSPKDNKSWALLSDTIITSANEGNIIFERQGSTGRGVTSFKGTTKVDFVEKHFSYMTSISYNGFNLSKGASLNTNDSISLFRYSPINDGNYVSSALYSLEIYDYDLTDEEITKVKTRMIAEYESKTGEKYVEYLKLDQGKLDINKLK